MELVYEWVKMLVSADKVFKTAIIYMHVQRIKGKYDDESTNRHRS